MIFEINVSKNHIHYFRVIVPYGNVKKVYNELKEKFPDYELAVYKNENIASYVDMDECDF